MEKPKFIEVSEAKAFMVFCFSCNKPLYEAKDDNPITRIVAQNTAEGHIHSFSQPHEVRLLNFKPNIN